MRSQRGPVQHGSNHWVDPGQCLQGPCCENPSSRPALGYLRSSLAETASTFSVCLLQHLAAVLSRVATFGPIGSWLIICPPYTALTSPQSSTSILCLHKYVDWTTFRIHNSAASVSLFTVYLCHGLQISPMLAISCLDCTPT